VTESDDLFSWGSGGYGALGHNDIIDRLIPTRVDVQHFSGAKIITAAAGPFCVSTAVTEDGVLYSWGKARAFGMLTGLGHNNMQDKLVRPKMVVNLCIWLPEGEAGELEGVVRLMGGGQDQRRGVTEASKNLMLMGVAT
jgi:alpha-tubulin suppressor-like RCC1 family protein